MQTIDTKPIATKKFAEELEQGKADMQGLLVRGYNQLNAACYLLLEISDGIAAKEYFNLLTEKFITPGNAKKKVDGISSDPEQAVHVAFTSNGLKKLGISESILQSFSREFLEGMNYSGSSRQPNHVDERSLLLGDTENNSPEHWNWGNKNHPVDCILMLYALDQTALKGLLLQSFTNVQKGVKQVRLLNTYQYNKFSKEHFGFDDGISQPIIKGMSRSKKAVTQSDLINPGEFILGYRNAYNHYSPSPLVLDEEDAASLDTAPLEKGKKDLGKNGSYMVFRQIEQHVEKFWKYLYHHSKEAGLSKVEKAIKLGAKMVGRWPEGQPLTTCPEGDGLTDTDLQNSFQYKELDPLGKRCPFGAHIRRTNPRDQVHTGRDAKSSLEVSLKHRMLRRGRIYGFPLNNEFNIEQMILESKDAVVPKEKDRVLEEKRGLHFICLVSDISRQFEFVQNVWANTSTFGDLCNEVDPMISPRPTPFQPSCHEFTTPQEFVRNRYTGVPEFTTVIGGAYFFMPGIRALKYLMK